MASLNYDRLDIDLAVVRAGVQVIIVGSGYDGVLVAAMPAGAVVSLGFKSSPAGAMIPLTAAGQSFEFVDECGNPYIVDEGLFVTNPAAAGVVTLMISRKNPAP